MTRKKTGVNHGGRRPGAGRPREYLTFKIPYKSRDHSILLTEPVKISPEFPTDPSDIILAQNDDNRYGIYIRDDWYGASQALVILAYLQEHKTWLEEKAKENSHQS